MHQMNNMAGYGLAALLSLMVANVCADSPDKSAPQGEVLYPKAYDGFQASRDAHAYAEARRVDAINRQLGWNELLKIQAATGEPNTLYYRPYVPLRWDTPWVDASHWPYGVGRIYGYGFYDTVPQPIGRREVQTGPNRWESFPVYAEDVVQPAIPLAPAKVDAPSPPPVPLPKGREF